MTELPEAPVTMFTNYKRTDGFEVSVTLRGSELKDVATLLDTAIQGIVKNGGTPVSRTFKKEKPPVEYVEGRVCPQDSGRLIKPPIGSKAPIKCENNKYNWQTKQSYGCQYIEWPNRNEIPERQVSEY